jgi:hypothetical protein
MVPVAERRVIGLRRTVELVDLGVGRNRRRGVRRRARAFGPRPRRVSG